MIPLLPACLLLLAAAAPPPAATPADIYGPLFVAVQQAQIFPDSKTFADATPRAAPARIMAAWAAMPTRDPAALRRFVAQWFEVRGEATMPPLRDRIRDLWPVLGRAPVVAPPGASALDLPAAYVVPGDRFQELYYWDSYFTMLGLRADGQAPLIEAMLEDFTSLVERYDHVPNGTRSYYLSRSQPPFLALMMDLSTATDPALLRRRLAALRREHDWWMADAACARRAGACGHLVRMPDGSLLNRYHDARDTPREEAWREDEATAAAARPRPAPAVWQDLRSAAESGWDFSSRWLRDPMRLASIHTGDIVPVDLNSLLWMLERAIARRAAALGDPTTAARYADLAERRRAAMDRYLWQPAAGRFADWDRQAGAATPVHSAATLFPLFAGLATPAQAAAVARVAAAELVAPGGLRTTGVRTGQQWDAPNGWAPLQWIAVDGLRRYGEDALARRIAGRWVATVDRTYRATGKLLEKYDVEEVRAGGGGEYPTQNGFGWTNGVTAALIDRGLAPVP